MPQVTESLMGRVAVELGRAPEYSQRGVKESILVAAATSYGAKSPDDLTQPTGFDPEAARLFEAIVESAYLVANADGEFDDAERKAFEHVVVAACEGKVGASQVTALLQDLAEQLHEDGADKRVEMVTRGITRSEHAREIKVTARHAHAFDAGVTKHFRLHAPRFLCGRSRKRSTCNEKSHHHDHKDD